MLLIAHCHFFITMLPDPKAPKPELQLNLEKNFLKGKGSSRRNGLLSQKHFILLVGKTSEAGESLLQ